MMSSVRTITTTRLLSTTPIKATASSQTPRHLINIAQLTNDEFSSLINKLINLNNWSNQINHQLKIIKIVR